MAAAPCHHSKDQPAPTHRGRDRLRRRRQRPSQVRSKTSGARPCEASGALLLSNGGTGAATPHAPGRPSAFGYFPRGKYLVRPQADETSHKKWISYGWQGGGFLAFLCSQGFASGGDQRLSARPLETFGALLLKRMGFHKLTGFLWMAGRRASLLSSVSQDFASAEATKGLSARPLKPSGHSFLKQMGVQVNWFLVDGREGGFLLSSVSRGFSAEATKGFPLAL